MKNKVLMLLGLLSTLTLTSCRISFLNSKTASTSVYSLFNGEVAENGNIEYEYLQDKELLPYFSIPTYLSLYDKYLISNYNVEYSNFGSEEMVIVSDYDQQNIFVADINSSHKVVIMNGNFSDAFTVSKDYSKSSLYACSDTSYEIAKEPTNLREMSYSKMGFTTFNKAGVTYYPLSLLECIFASGSGIHHLFNYSRLLQYSEYEELTDTTYKVDGEDVTAFKEMKKFINKNLPTMPLYLREDRRASFLFTIENKYGLKYTRGINSMVKYLQKQNFYDDFLAEDTSIRNEAYYKTFALLDDGHTSIRDHKDFAWLEGEFNQYGSKVSHILSIRQQLSTQRTLAPGEVYYSTDEKYDKYNRIIIL